jgi:hypothetical protein
MLRLSAEPHSSKTDPKFDAAGLRNGVIVTEQNRRADDIP